MPSFRRYVGDRKLRHVLIERLMVRIFQLDQDLMRPRGEVR
jgi:hypothetical protein